MTNRYNDKQIYEPLKRDPTPALQRRLNGKLLALKKRETIDIQLYYRLRCRVPQSAKLYGLPKLHRPNIKRLVTKPASCVHFFYYYCWHRFGCSPLDVLSRPSSLDLSLLPPFYNALLPAWQKVNGGFSNRSDTLVICASGGLFKQDVSSVSTKLVYSYLLSAADVTPHCVAKFVPQFGPLY